jgi:hypothetical protein
MQGGSIRVPAILVRARFFRVDIPAVQGHAEDLPASQFPREYVLEDANLSSNSIVKQK